MARCDSYSFGECTYGACSVDDWIPEGLGDGGDWAANAPGAGLQVTMTPTVGAVVSYCRGDGYSPFGHVAKVLDVYGDGTFRVQEMNFVGWDQWDERVSTLHDVCGFLLPPGVQPGAGAGAGRGAGAAAGDVIQMWGLIQDELNVQANARFLQWGDLFNAIAFEYGRL